MICCHCNKEILPGEARYSGGEGADPPRYQHWDCHEKWVAEIMTGLKNVPELVKKAERLINKIRNLK